MNYKKPNLLYYRIAQTVSKPVSALVFKRKMLRNEIKGKQGPFVVIANHGAALDFVNLIDATKRPMSFVISNCFYNTLPIKGFLRKMGVIPKQQFQTTVNDLKAIKAVIDAGEPVVIYPAGLMCEDGLSTPIPSATYKFLKWLDVDVYVARSRGTYFVTPKWGKGIRPGKTTMDIYKLFSKEELKKADLDTVRTKTDEALLFDAYREQEEALVPYRKNRNIHGLEQVLYMCPHCMTEFSMTVPEEGKLRCIHCGYETESDEYGFLHRRSEHGPDIRYVSDWSRRIYDALKDKITRNQESVLETKTLIRMIDYKKNKFLDAGQGTVTLSPQGFRLTGQIHGEDTNLLVPIGNIPTLPFSPGNYLEIQRGQDIYRCVPEDGRLVMKFINMVKICYDLAAEARQETRR